MVSEPVEPNRHALAAELQLPEGRAEVRGYQCFNVHAVGNATGGDGSAGVPMPHWDDAKLIVKRDLVRGYFQPGVMRHRTVLDVGGNAGFFPLWAVSAGARRADSIDVDAEYVRMCNEIAGHVGAGRVRAHAANLVEWEGGADVVLAFAMVHWLYGATTGYGSLERAVEELARRTGSLLLVEWVAPDDAAIEFLGHTRINVPGEGAGEYSLPVFLGALGRSFEVVEELGRVSATRTLLACWKRRGDREMDLGWAAEPAMELGRMWSSRCVATDGAGVRMWSRVFDGGDRVVKQASARLARREAECLALLAGEAGFPRLMGSREEGGYGVVEMEKVEGLDVEEWAAGSGGDGAAARVFAAGLLRIVATLQRRGIVHRDIRPANVLVRGGEPVLLDFGWAELGGCGGGFVPEGLGEGYRPRGGGFDDAYSAGKLLAEVVGGEELRAVGRAMAAGEPALRLGAGAALKVVERLV